MSETILKAMKEADQLAKMRAEKFLTKEAVVTIYGHYPDDDPTPEAERVAVISPVRPQDFAVSDRWKYVWFVVLVPDQDGRKVENFLVHGYWDDKRSEEDFCRLVADNARRMLVYGRWEPCAPSDPLKDDDFWDDDLPIPARYWSYDDEPLFNNFARGPMERATFVLPDTGEDEDHVE